MNLPANLYCSPGVVSRHLERCCLPLTEVVQLKINCATYIQDYILYMGSSSTRLHNVISCFIIFDHINMMKLVLSYNNKESLNIPGSR